MGSAADRVAIGFELKTNSKGEAVRLLCQAVANRCAPPPGAITHGDRSG